MPGYILVKMMYGDDIWHAVTRTQYITGFVGPKGRPICITDEEARKMGVDGGEATIAKMDVVVNVGDMVEIIEGSLSSFVGTVKAVDNENQKVTLEAIPKPDKEFTCHMDVLKAGLEHEEYVTSLINDIYAAAYEVKDFRTMQFLDWFVKEQGEEETNANDLITKMELFGSDPKSLYMLNQELKARVYTAPSLVL